MGKQAKVIQSILPLAALFLVACGGSSGPNAGDSDGQVHAASEAVPSPPPIGLPPPPQPIGPPKILVGPNDAKVGNGGGVRFSVGASGVPPLSYTWYKDGAAMASANRASYDIASVTPSDAALYSVRVTDGLGQSTLSSSARLNVVRGAWARVSGRPVGVFSAPPLHPSMTLCGPAPQQPHVAHTFVNTGAGRVDLVVRAFDGVAWKQLGGALNATASASPTDPSIACVADGTGNAWPVVAWTEGTPQQLIHVRYWNGVAWVPAGDWLNISPGSSASKPVLRIPPFDLPRQSTPVGGITRHAALAWIEDGKPTLLRWDNGWKWPSSGPQIGYANGAVDIALQIDLAFPTDYRAVLAWTQMDAGRHLPRVAVNAKGPFPFETWWALADPEAILSPTAATAPSVGRIAVGTGWFSGAPAPVLLWADESAKHTLQARYYANPNYVSLISLRPWSTFAAFDAPALRSASFDGDAVGGVFCGARVVPDFGLAIVDDNGLEVRHVECGLANVVNWVSMRPRHFVLADEIVLRMRGSNDPIVAGTISTGAGRDLSVWKYYD